MRAPAKKEGDPGQGGVPPGTTKGEGLKMAKVVYGVSGEGSGHSSRSREMIRHLESRGHEVRVASYDRGYSNLKDDFRVFEIEGLAIETADNRVSVARTVVENLSRLSRGTKRLSRLKTELFRKFAPDCVITDFEPMTAYLASRLDLPLVSIDNQHRMRYMKFPRPRHLRGDAAVTETVIRAMVPRPDVCLVTTFFFGPVLNDRTFLFPPILRKEVLEAKPSTGKHILVYLTHGFDSFLEKLRHFPREAFIVYGGDREERAGRLTFKRASRDGFLRDLESCRAVMATAGFTLISEALHLGKPYLALPMKGQFEQELNALLLAEEGWGKNCRRLVGESVGDFLYRLPDYRRRLGKYPREDNERIKEMLDRLLAEDCALVRDYHRRSKT